MTRTPKGHKYNGAGQNDIASRLREENRQLTTRLAQLEAHRFIPLLRELAANLEALEQVGVYGWPSETPGISSHNKGGSKGDRKAISRLVDAENRIRRMNESISYWLDGQQSKVEKGVRIVAS